MALVVTCFVNPDDQYPKGQKIDYYFYFTRQIITQGQNKGKPLYDVSKEQCIKLGVSTPFKPDKIEELNGVPAYLTTVEDTYDGKKKIKPQWLNPQKRPKLSTEAANTIWNNLLDDEGDSQKKSDKSNNIDSDNAEGFPF